MTEVNVELEELLKSLGITYEEAITAYSRKKEPLFNLKMYFPSITFNINKENLFFMCSYLVNKYSAEEIIK